MDAKFDRLSMLHVENLSVTELADAMFCYFSCKFIGCNETYSDLLGAYLHVKRHSVQFHLQSIVLII